MTSSIDSVLYLSLSLITLVKISVILTVSKHDMLLSTFIGSELIELVGALGTSVLIIFSLVIISIIAQLTKDTYKNTLLGLTIILLSVITLYNIGIYV